MLLEVTKAEPSQKETTFLRRQTWRWAESSKEVGFDDLVRWEEVARSREQKFQMNYKGATKGKAANRS